MPYGHGSYFKPDCPDIGKPLACSPGACDIYRRCKQRIARDKEMKKKNKEVTT